MSTELGYVHSCHIAVMAKSDKSGNAKFAETAQLGLEHPRHILAENIQHLAAAHDCESQAEFSSLAATYDLTISGSSYSRARNGVGAVDIDFIAKLSIMFDMDPWRFLARNLGGPRFQDLSAGGRPMPNVTTAEQTNHIPPAPKSKPKKRRVTEKKGSR